MQYRKDHYSKKAKEEQHLARSYYKLEEIQNKYGLISRNGRVMDFGASPGSWLEYLLKVAGNKGRIFALDIKPLAKRFSAGVTFFECSIFEFDPQVVLEDGGKLNNIVSDMAPNTTGDKELDSMNSIELCSKLLELADIMLVEGGNLVCKVFQGSEYKSFYDKMKTKFHTLRTFKPKSSRKNSKEIYLIGKGLK